MRRYAVPALSALGSQRPLLLLDDATELLQDTLLLTATRVVLTEGVGRQKLQGSILALEALSAFWLELFHGSAHENLSRGSSGLQAATLGAQTLGLATPSLTRSGLRFS